MSAKTAEGRRSDVLLLGPHPSRSSLSIRTYFSDLRANIGACEFTIDSLCPGCRGVQSSAVRAWMDTYVRWPAVLRRSTAGLFHVVDQGLGWYAAFLKGQRFVITVHDLLELQTLRGKLPFPPPPRRRRLLLRASLKMLSRAAYVVTNSQHVTETIRTELQLTTTPITVLSQILDPRFTPPDSHDITAWRSRWGFSDCSVVLYVGSAAPHKNRANVLRAFALLRTWLPRVRLVLVSSEPTMPEKSIIAASGLAGSVHFLSPVSVEHLPKIYGAADVLVFPSLYEGGGRPPLEAMACGCPVISSTRGGLAETIQDSAMTLIDPTDHREIAHKLYAVLMTPALASEFRSRGLQRAAQCRRENATQALQTIYRHLLTL